MSGDTIPPPVSGGAGPGTSPPPIEIELKYDVTDRALLDPLLEAAAPAGFAGGEWHEALVDDRYVDTPGRAVEHAGYAARIRERGDRRILGLKSLTPAVGAVHRREELEAPAGEGLDPRTWPASDARDLLLRMIGEEPLQERFQVRQRRRVREVSDADGAVEISVDEVEVLRGGHLLGTYSGIEVELRRGDEAILGRLATALEATGGVRPASGSKFEAARDLAEGAAPASGRSRARPARRARRRPSGSCSRSGRHPASRRMIPSRRRVARCSASTSRACSRRRPGHVPGRTPRTCTRCGSRRAACGRPGASSGTDSAVAVFDGPSAACGRWPGTWGASAISTC